MSIKYALYLSSLISLVNFLTSDIKKASNIANDTMPKIAISPKITSDMTTAKSNEIPP